MNELKQIKARLLAITEAEQKLVLPITAGQLICWCMKPVMIMVLAPALFTLTLAFGMSVLS